MPFNFNMAEIVALVVLAVIIFGPEKLPGLARKTARVVNYLRDIANDARGQLREQLGPEFDDLDLSDLNPKTLINKHVLNPVQAELAPELGPIKQTLNSATTPAAPTAAPFDTEAT